MSTSTGPKSQKEARQVLARAVAAWLAHVSPDVQLFDKSGMTDVQWRRLVDASDELILVLRKRAGDA